MADPDYNGYLQAIHPGTDWNISRFSHGSINATCRAVKTSGDAGPPSLMLKHASPHFGDEDSGYVQSFSISRKLNSCLSGATATTPSGEHPETCSAPKERNRGLLRTKKSEQVSVMLMEDLGNVRNLCDTILAWAELSPSPKTHELVKSIGSVLGTSLATMHSSQTMRAIEADALHQVLSRRLTDNVVWFLAMELLPEYLKGSPRAVEYFTWLPINVVATA